MTRAALLALLLFTAAYGLGIPGPQGANPQGPAWYVSRGEVDLTDGTPTALFSVPIAQGSGVGGEVVLSIWCTDGSSLQIHSEDVTFAVINESGTLASETATATTLDADADTVATTLSASFSIAEDTADVATFKVDANTSLSTPTTFRVRFQVGCDSPGVTVP